MEITEIDTRMTYPVGAMVVALILAGTAGYLGATGAIVMALLSAASAVAMMFVSIHRIEAELEHLTLSGDIGELSELADEIEYKVKEQKEDETFK